MEKQSWPQHGVEEEKRQGRALSAQISRLNRALSSLSTVRTALGSNGDDTTNDATNNTTDDFNVLAAEIQNAIDSHEEIKGWNEKAERVICLLDSGSRQRGVVVVMVALRVLAVAVVLLVGA